MFITRANSRESYDEILEQTNNYWGKRKVLIEATGSEHFFFITVAVYIGEREITEDAPIGRLCGKLLVRRKLL